MSPASEAEPPTRSSPNVARNRWQTPGQLLLFASCILALIFVIDVCALLLSGSGSERRDFISYWAAGQQLAHHQDPYDGPAILAMERSLGFPTPSQALIVRNPPSALLLVMPLGYIGFRTAALIWSLLLLGGWITSVWLLWSMQPRSIERLNVVGYGISPGLIACLFAPALACVFFGQTGLFALLGLAFFLRLHQSHPFAAGSALWLCALKPHLLFPFAAVLVLWIIVTRSYAVLVGAVVCVGGSAAAVSLLDPQVWSQYTQMMRTAGLEGEFVPCLSIALRFATSPNSTWLQYLPAAVGCVWAVRYYWQRRQIWSWVQHGPLVVLVSMLLSPYAWLTDQVLALPALLQAAFRSNFRSLLLLALASSAIEVAILGKISLHSGFYLWTAPVWLAWYLYEMRGAAGSSLYIGPETGLKTK